MELYTAITNRVPIVALNVQNANPYNYKTASEFLLYFDKDIDISYMYCLDRENFILKGQKSSPEMVEFVLRVDYCD